MSLHRHGFTTSLYRAPSDCGLLVCCIRIGCASCYRADKGGMTSNNALQSRLLQRAHERCCAAGEAGPHGSGESGAGCPGGGHCSDAGQEGGDSGAAASRRMAAGLRLCHSSRLCLKAMCHGGTDPTRLCSKMWVRLLMHAASIQH